MAGINFNDTTDKATSSGSSTGNTSKSFLVFVSYAPSGSGTIPTTYDDIAGVVNQSVEFTKTGLYSFMINVVGLYPHVTLNTNDSVYARILIDDVQVAEISSSTQGFTFYGDPGQKRLEKFQVISGTVTEGIRNVKIQLKAANGGRVNYDNTCVFSITMI
jgi:hypothetical protein